MKFRPVNIDVELVKQLILTQFPQWAELPIAPVASSGWDNRTFHLGKQMSVRLPSAAIYASQVEREHHWLPRIAPHLPLPIPTPLVMGKPAENYPWHWSVYSWLSGESADKAHLDNLCQFANALAEFLVALQKIDATTGPSPGKHNFYRGGDLAIYDEETRRAISVLAGKIDRGLAIAVWETALATKWCHQPVWIHGDMTMENLLVRDGRLNAVIDFGNLAIGDPACDLAIAWTFFKAESRNRFRHALFMDSATWARSKGWALWKSLITYAELPGTNRLAMQDSKRILNEIFSEI